MATVRAFEIPGLKLWFWSDDHEPPHFHAKRAGEWEVKVSFLVEPDEMIAFCWVEKRPSSRDLNEITDLSEEHRVALLEQWEEIHGW
jgi:hypothetical protein